MKKLAAFAVALALLSLPFTAKADKDPVSSGVFKVKQAEIFLTDKGVYISFTFFEPSKLDYLAVPAKILNIKKDSANSNLLETTYVETCSSLLGCTGRPIKATLYIHPSTERAWNKLIQDAFRDYEKLMTTPVTPTYKK